ncbi:hypothetical protein ATO00_07125 [Loigolactobacillus coryniformis subsp. coryniformis]|nr:hypothetical protein ATO00_07125 [Loigolactobacillus coryniformis subsp. coryniformis]
MKKVAVIMSTYNGSKYLDEQIHSILGQKNVEVELYIFDDISKDNTVEIIRKWMNSNRSIHLEINAKNIGAKKSFLNGLQRVSDADYYAFADQDDVWNEDKLLSGVEKLEQQINKEYKLYFSVARIVNENLEVQGMDSFDHRVLSFGEILTRNNGIGCTFVFNDKLKKQLDKLVVNKLGAYPLHDQLIYAVCASLNGYIYFDSTSHILYRQHSQNEVGGRKRSFLRKLLESGMFDKNKIRLDFIHDLDSYYGEDMSLENRLLIQHLIDYKLSLKIRLVQWSN